MLRRSARSQARSEAECRHPRLCYLSLALLTVLHSVAYLTTN